MKLQKFKEIDKKKIGIIIFTISCILLIVGIYFYRTFALFEVSEKKNIIEGTVQDLGDIYFAYYLDDIISRSSPEKNTGYVFDTINSSCNNGASIEWDYEKWAAVVSNLVETKTKCYLRFKKQYSESILNGAYPVLSSELIPVTIDNDGIVKKADITTEWYNYTKKVWANAIILKDESTGNNYTNGSVIPESAIESYFVWIPRYRYQIFNDGNYTALSSVENKEQTINVVFETKDVTVSNGSSIGSWLTHSAFTSFNTNGMWVGKFETGTTLTSDYNVRNGDAVQIKPNVSSWRSIQVGNLFYTSYDYKRNLESHAMKNTEWGAVAYLSHSIYGNHSSIRLNNNSDYITGYASVNEPTCGYTGTNETCNQFGTSSDITLPYNTTTGYLASTTGNITGIYDMSGGAWEHVMGVMVDSSGNPLSGRNNLYNSGFNGTLGCPTCEIDLGNDSSITSITNGYGFLDKKYYDYYAYSTTSTQYQRRVLGDATGEIGPFSTETYAASNGTSLMRNVSSWYTDLSYFVNTYDPWFNRGAAMNDGTHAGLFAFNGAYGRVLGNVSFRIVLMP